MVVLLRPVVFLSTLMAARDHPSRAFISACDTSMSEPSDDIEDAQVYRKRKGQFKPHKPKDSRDKLLYAVTEVTPPPTKLGLFRLEPSAGCGDLICAPVRVDGEREKSEQTVGQTGSAPVPGVAAQLSSHSRARASLSINQYRPQEPCRAHEPCIALEKPASPRIARGQFVIKRVAYQYEYQGGAYRMIGKRAEVKKASRDAAEAFFERMLPTDEDGSPPDGPRPELKGSGESERKRSRRADDADDSAGERGPSPHDP